MATPAVATGRRISFRWLIDAPSDLGWYIGSALVGWLYVGLVLLAVALLHDPLNDSFGIIRLGGLHIPLTLHVLVFATWAFLLDAPHLFSTLARTFLDPEERAHRRRELWVSWAWFFLGPACILLPYAVNALVPLSPAILGLGAGLFAIFFRLWAYYHVVRQHWGFVALYKRKNGDMAPVASKADAAFFNLTMYAPLALFITSPVYAATPGMPPLSLERLSFLPAVHMLLWALYGLGLVGYAAYQAALWRRGHALNGPKLLLLAAVVPLHLAAFSNPWLAALVVPIITVGHNIQYHRIVWMYGRNKYVASQEGSRFRWARLVFSRAWVYMGLGLLFTFALYRGPWIEWLQGALGVSLNQSVLAGVGMMAGFADPAAMTLGQQLFGSFLLGWAMQHYYLDSKIWRVGRDKTVAQQLNVEGAGPQ